MPKHIHSDLIKAWADGAEIQFLDDSEEWTNIKDPSWDKRVKYRIKPNKDKKIYLEILRETYEILDNNTKTYICLAINSAYYPGITSHRQDIKNYISAVLSSHTGEQSSFITYECYLRKVHPELDFVHKDNREKLKQGRLAWVKFMIEEVQANRLDFNDPSTWKERKMKVYTCTCMNIKNQCCFSFECFSKEAAEQETARMKSFGLLCFWHEDYINWE